MPTCRRPTKKLVALAYIASLTLAYFGVYVWARHTGLFIWARMHAMHHTPGKVSTIMPLSNVSIVILPCDDMSTEEFQQRSDSLMAKKDRSAIRWPFFEWFAECEAALNPKRAAEE